MRIFVALTFFCAGMVAAFADDAKGSADHPLLPRYEGSEIARYATEAFTEYRLMTAPAKAYGGIDKNLGASLALEGKLTRVTYRAPADRSVLEVFRNYENALKDKGFEPIYSCTKETCGGRNFNAVLAAGKLYGFLGEYQAEQRYLAAKLSRPQGDVYAMVYAVLNKAGGGPNRNRVMLQLDVIEMKPMEDKMVVLAAYEMKAGMTTDGRVAVYGILFDFDKADIRPDSKPQLDEITKLLKADPALEVLIVGHTDSKGGLDYNRDLSEKRAGAVVKMLAREYGIAAKRLTSVGIGMASPVSTNRTDEGRAKNRRVELVER